MDTTREMKEKWIGAIKLAAATWNQLLITDIPKITKFSKEHGYSILFDSNDKLISLFIKKFGQDIGYWSLDYWSLPFEVLAEKRVLEADAYLTQEDIVELLEFYFSVWWGYYKKAIINLILLFNKIISDEKINIFKNYEITWVNDARAIFTFKTDSESFQYWFRIDAMYAGDCFWQLNRIKNKDWNGKMYSLQTDFGEYDREYRNDKHSLFDESGVFEDYILKVYTYHISGLLGTFIRRNYEQN